MRFYELFMDFYRPIKTWEKLLTKFASFWIKFTYLCLRQVTASFQLAYSRHLTILGSCKKPNWRQFFTRLSSYWSVINFVITSSKFTAEPLAFYLWFHSHFDNVMTQFLSSIRGQTHKKTDVNLYLYIFSLAVDKRTKNNY